MRWRNVKTGVLVEGPDWLDMPQGIYEPEVDESAGDCIADSEPADTECCEEASHCGEPPRLGDQDDDEGEISSTDW